MGKDLREYFISAPSRRPRNESLHNGMVLPNLLRRLQRDQNTLLEVIRIEIVDQRIRQNTTSQSWVLWGFTRCFIDLTEGCRNFLRSLELWFSLCIDLGMEDGILVLLIGRHGGKTQSQRIST